MEIQTKLVKTNIKDDDEHCNVCGIYKKDYGFTFEINDKNELLCSKCWEESKC